MWIKKINGILRLEDIRLIPGLIDLLFTLYKQDKPEKIGIEKTIFYRQLNHFGMKHVGYAIYSPKLWN